MTIRFLQTTPSPVASAPFMAGQIIHVDQPEQWMLDLIDGVRAEAVTDVEPERAIAQEPVRKARKGRPS